MVTQNNRRGEPRYGLAVFASTGNVELRACVTTKTGNLKPVSEKKLETEAPEWHAVLLYCRAGRRIHEALTDLPQGVRESATAFLQIMSLFGQFDDPSLLAADPPPANEDGMR